MHCISIATDREAGCYVPEMCLQEEALDGSKCVYYAMIITYEMHMNTCLALRMYVCMEREREREREREEVSGRGPCSCSP